MASETPSGREGLSQHPFVEKLIPDPAQPAPSTVRFEGLVGKSAKGEGHWRLYLDRDLSDYVEFEEEDVLNSESIAKERSPMGLESTKVWLKRDATITRTHSRRVQADAAETASGRYADPSAEGVLPGLLENPYGGAPGALHQRRVIPNPMRRTTPDYGGIRLGPGRVTGSRGLAPGVEATERVSESMRYVPGDHFYTAEGSGEFDSAIDEFGYTYEGKACYVYNFPKSVFCKVQTSLASLL